MVSVSYRHPSMGRRRPTRHLNQLLALSQAPRRRLAKGEELRACMAPVAMPECQRDNQVSSSIAGLGKQPGTILEGASVIGQVEQE